MGSDEIQKNRFHSVAVQWQNRSDLQFADLVGAIRHTHKSSYQTAIKAINRYATMRNWLIGFFIVEYQQKGKDRAAYGTKLLKRLEESIGTRELNVTLFQNSRMFYVRYPQVADLFNIQIQPTVLVKLEDQEIQPTMLVESALAGMDNNLFVSTYLLQLPDKSVLESFIKNNSFSQ